ncbi:hypothetical protein D3C81_1388920 [compost metagenome]
MTAAVDPLVAEAVLFRFFIEFAPFEIVLSQQKIEQEPNNRQQSKHDNPSHGAGRIAVLHKYGETNRDDGQGLKNTNERTAEFTEDAKSEIIESK